jgi:hypothetical protein
MLPCCAWNSAAFSLRYASVGASGVDCNEYIMLYDNAESNEERQWKRERKRLGQVRTRMRIFIWIFIDYQE